MKKNLVLAGLLAAMICVATCFLHIPIVGGGYIHLGDTLIYLAAALLPTPYAVAVAVVGVGLSDLLVAPLWTPFTVVIKAVMVCAFTAREPRFICRRNGLAPVFAGLVGVGGYYGAEVVLLRLSGATFEAAAVGAVTAIPFNGLQELVSGVMFVLLALALDRLQIKKRFNRK